MYMRMYNDELVSVYISEDLKNSDIIGKLKGRDSAGVTIIDGDEVTYCDIKTISSKELQLIIRNSTKVTIAIKLEDEEILEYFCDVAMTEIANHPTESLDEKALFEWMNRTLDAEIVYSYIWKSYQPKVIAFLKQKGLLV